MKIFTLRNGSSNESDRIEMARLLLKMGYSVRIGREKEGNKNTYRYFVEYWEGKELNDGIKE